MDKRVTHRRSCSPRRRRQKRSCSRSYDSSSYSDTNSHFSRRNRRLRCHDLQSRSRSRSPRRITRTYDHRRHHADPSGCIDSQDVSLRDDTFSMTGRVKYQGKEQDDREARGVGYTRASKKHRHIAPNASALESIVLGTARSRDRMDERERARAKKKLKDLNATAKTSETFTVDKAVKMDR